MEITKIIKEKYMLIKHCRCYKNNSSWLNLFKQIFFNTRADALVTKPK